MLLNMLAAKNTFRNLSLFTLPSLTPGLSSSKCGSLNFVSSLIKQRLNCLRFGSSKCHEEETHDEHDMISNDSKAEKWSERHGLVLSGLEDYHDSIARYARCVNQPDEIFESPSLLMEHEQLAYRKRWASYRLMRKIEDVARRLIDGNVDKICQVFYLAERCEFWVQDIMLKKNIHDQCWMSLIKSSKQPLADKLRQKLEETGISPQTFSTSMKIVYRKLQLQTYLYDSWAVEVVDYGPDDIIGVLNDLSIIATDYECIRLLFNLEELDEWQIKDSKREKEE